MASILKLPEPKCEIMIKSIIHILKAHGMPYSKQPKNIKISHICHFGLIEGKSLKLAKVPWQAFFIKFVESVVGQCIEMAGSWQLFLLRWLQI